MSKLRNAIDAIWVRNLNIERIRKWLPHMCRTYHTDPVTITQLLGPHEQAVQVANEHNEFIEELYNYNLWVVTHKDKLYNCAHRDVIWKVFVSSSYYPSKQ